MTYTIDIRPDHDGAVSVAAFTTQDEALARKAFTRLIPTYPMVALYEQWPGEAEKRHELARFEAPRVEWPSRDEARVTFTASNSDYHEGEVRT